MAASILPRSPRRCLPFTTLFLILILSSSVVHAADPGREYTHVLFQDDFEDWSEDAWEIYIPPDAPYGTSLKILDDDGNKVLYLKGTVGAVVGETYWTNYTLIAKFKIVNVSEGVFISLRMGEEGWYTVEVPQDPVFIKQVGEEPLYLEKVGLTISTDAWHIVKVVCVGDGFWVYIDGELIMECRDEVDPILSGRIGFSCGSNGDVYLDDVWVLTTHVNIVEYLFMKASNLIEEAGAIGVDIDDQKYVFEEAKQCVSDGDLVKAEKLFEVVIEKVVGLIKEKQQGTEEPSPDDQQPSQNQQLSPSLSGGGLTIQSVATLITIGGAGVGVVGWIFRTRGNRRKRAILFTELMQMVDDAHKRFRMNAVQCETELYRLKDRVIVEFKQGLITEKDYRVLDERIEGYLGRLREEAES